LGFHGRWRAPRRGNGQLLHRPDRRPRRVAPGTHASGDVGAGVAGTGWIAERHRAGLRLGPSTDGFCLTLVTMTDSSNTWQDFSDWLSDRQERRGIPGTAVRVFTAEQRLFERGFGWRNENRQEPVDMDTFFGIASVTKSFTALTVLKAATDGLLSLDDP